MIGLSEGRETFLYGGVSVTLLCQPLRRALTFRNLCFWEVRDLLVLEDPTGAFEKIRRRFSQWAPKIDAAVLGATFEAAEAALRLSETAVGLDRVRFLREALHRLCAAFIYREVKQRVPRVRQLRRLLPRRAWLAYSRGMGLSSADEAVRRALRMSPSAAVREEVSEKLEARRGADALFILRRHFHVALAERPRGEAYRRVLHEGDADDVIAAIAVVSSELKLERWAPTSTVRALKRLKLERGSEAIHARYAGAFKPLAE